MNRDRPQLDVRLPEPKDLELLWRWANDPDVRRNSFSPEEISLESHTKWFRQIIASPSSRIYIIELAGNPVGQVRYDGVSITEAEIDVSIDARHRGNGFGSLALGLTTELGRAALNVERVVGIVMKSNAVSCAAFRKAGFKESEPRSVQGQLCRVFHWPPDRTGTGGDLEKVGIGKGSNSANR